MKAKGSHGAQQFEKQPEYTEVNPGQETRLTCKIFNKKGQCSWQKDGKPVGIYLGKYEWAGNPDVGDCSLRILNAALEYDDGEWECQLTASDFAAQDALTSRPMKLVVRVPPNAPQVEYNGTYIPTGRNVTAPNDKRVAVKCTSRYGNPPPYIKWFVGDEEVFGVNQTNKTEDDNPKKWAATSILDYTFHKGLNGKRLRCVAVHEAYPTKSRDTQVLLDVQYGPQVTLEGAPEGDLEENKDEVTLSCLADANPTATIMWRKIGKTDVYSFQPTIQFKPLNRRNAGSYTCEASNIVGKSQVINVDIDVKYVYGIINYFSFSSVCCNITDPPKITRVGPDRTVVASLYNRTVLVCEAEGNPPPSYQWLQKTNTAEETVYVRGAEQTLVIHNVTYEYQGSYFCKASNVISGVERTIQSDEINLSVMGAPQVLRHAVEREIAVERGSEAILSVLFCSNPGPSKAIWEWGSMKLEAGYEMGRFTAEKIEKSQRSDCYEAKLRIARTDSADSRHYYLNIENNKGNDKYSVILQVRGLDILFADPLSMATVISVIIGCLILLVIVVLIILYAFKAEKWCFSRHHPHIHHPHVHNNGKTGFASIPQTELHLGHHQSRKTRPPDPALPADYHIMKQQPRNERSFRGRAYPVDPTLMKKDINYADLQLPKTSNNGSMKKSNRAHHQQQQQLQQQQQQHQQHQHHPSAMPRNIPPNVRTDYAEIQFKPRSNEQAEV
ncbi:Kin of IRRE-like protein 3 [Orchesella cincta]|uniref:Kin of IRRE-like protein 3 n=1 Tax=Orchesella cincta TaxID=48709 RepID=A0A1D2N0V7_ORCCI|nr:Kin of IRRE-like protein 3 [Orchesella cincta]